MMLKRLKTLSIIGMASLLAAFSGQEKFVELEGYLNGRTSAKFRRSDNNIKTVLNRGTRGEILSHKKLASGNYGIQVKVLSGNNKDQIMWVYYNVKNPDLALYDVAPQSWTDYTPAKVAQVEQASGVETIRDTPAIRDVTPGIENAYTNEQQEKSEAAKAIELMMIADEEVKNVPIPTARPDCESCAVDTTDYTRVSIKPATRSTVMAARCDTLMNNKGEMGELGKYMYRTMSKSQYRGQYLKSGAMGAFCPRFNRLTEDQKLKAWVWMWAAVGQRESQCESDIPHRVTPRPGRGIWAMEARYSDRAWRGAACKDVNGAYGQALCSIDIMYQTTLKQGDTARGDRTSYWSTIMDGKADSRMKRFELCY